MLKLFFWIPGLAAFVLALAACGPTPGPEVVVQVDCVWGTDAHVWLDENANGIWDQDEEPLPGVRVQAKGDAGGVVLWAVSDENGVASFYSMVPCEAGAFEVSAEIPPGYRLTTQRNVEFGVIRDDPTATPVPPTPTLTPTRPPATPATEITTLPLPWPLTMPTGAQVQEARECDLEALADERYSDVTMDELRASHPVVTPCDWAVLAAAYALRAEADESALQPGQLAWANAISQNVAHAFLEPLYAYLGISGTVAPPPLAQDPLTGVVIHYEWTGLGEPHEVEWVVTIENADTVPKVTGTVAGQDYSAVLDVEVVQALGRALTDLLPVADSESLVVCYDNYPDWQITLTYHNGTTAKLATHGSNIYNLGGPWWVELDDQLYFQPSPTIVIALADIVTALELPIGEPAATYCFGLESSLLDVLYPGY